MSEQVIIQKYEVSSYFKRLFFNFKINEALKNCNKIKEYLLSKDYLSKFDTRLKLITSDGINNQVGNSYLLYKGYNTDGSIKPIKKYTIMNGEVVEYSNKIVGDIIIVDLYEKSVYLHSYTQDSQYITGYLIKETINSKKEKVLIFSNEKVKIYIKNTNRYDTNSVIDDFVNKYIM